MFAIMRRMGMAAIMAVMVASTALAAPPDRGRAKEDPFTSFLDDDVQIPPYTIETSVDGTALTLSGGIRFALVKDFAAALNKSPHVRTLYLTSPGGRFGAADDLAKLVRDHRLDTYVAEECSSACTEIFAAGRHRTLRRSARLGFHGASLGPAPSFLAWFVDRAVVQHYVDAGIDKKFMERAVSIPPASIWYPTIDELFAAHVITGIGEGDGPGTDDGLIYPAPPPPPPRPSA